jgi:hypothetical protein
LNACVAPGYVVIAITLPDAEGDVHVIDSVAQTKGHMLDELRSLDADPEWLERMTARDSR